MLFRKYQPFVLSRTKKVAILSQIATFSLYLNMVWVAFASTFGSRLCGVTGQIFCQYQAMCTRRF